MSLCAVLGPAYGFVWSGPPTMVVLGRCSRRVPCSTKLAGCCEEHVLADCQRLEGFAGDFNVHGVRPFT